MDNYPENLKPPQDEWGGIDKTQFSQWWATVKAQFPTVPDNVAQYWLHEHWGRSPYRYMASRRYAFELMQWETLRLKEIRSTWDNFHPAQAGCIEQGRKLVTEEQFGQLYPTGVYMKAHKNFPAPIIVLDNRDGHLNVDYPPIWDVPACFALIEGHSRFSIASYLRSIGGLGHSVDVWLMKKNPH
ncbi:hypothetical protein HNQ36_000001 [Afipia massiliensis]|uniref:Uncharacterized protein n=1 Tax=Afipia massiliensis TaxID=211460 RepID=A0A840MPZ5_9BRAD|nr:hypothetical protein [Afipia massiliensis]MBB5050053.1 hypothetical protein [Afipia massiliensis]